jgi:hypothetical protein
VIAFARREQGLVVAAGNPLRLADIAGVGARRARLALRPPAPIFDGCHKQLQGSVLHVELLHGY